MPLDFPSSPTNGQVYGNYYYNSARGAWNALLPAATPNFFTNATLNTSTLVDATATASVTSKTPLIIKGLSGQTANLQEWQDSTGNVITKITSGGDFVTNNRATVGATSAFGNTWLSVQSRFAAEVGLVVRGQASQTGNLQEWQNSSGTVLAKVEPSGNISGKGIIAYDYSQSIAGTAATVPSVVRGAASQTADLQQWQSSTGAVLSEINSAGELQVPRIGVGSIMPTTTRLFSSASAATEIPIIARGAASQTANLQEWQNSSTTLLSRIDPNGSFITNGGVTAASSVTGTTPVNGGTSGGVVIRTPASGTQTSAYLQFVNNANTVEYASIAANPSSVVTITGKVTMPQQPVYAGSISNYTSTTSNYFPATVDIFNIGFSKSGNNRLTAQVAGKYFVSAQQLVNTTGTTAYFHILKNGSSVAYAYSNADDTYDLVVNALVDLQVNDYIELYYGTTTTYSWPQPHSYYSVFKVS